MGHQPQTFTHIYTYTHERVQKTTWQTTPASRDPEFEKWSKDNQKSGMPLRMLYIGFSKFLPRVLSSGSGRLF